MNIELKTCPCCGGEATLWKRGTKYGNICYVKCETCGLQTRAVSCKEEFDSEEWEDTGLYTVARAWNTRV